MNEIKRYDQAMSDRLEHLPMPPEDMAWAEMKKLLEEDDDNPVVVPFFRRPGCLLPALVAVLLLTIGGWLYFNRDTVPAPVSEQLPAATDTLKSSSRYFSDSHDTSSPVTTGSINNGVALPDTTAGPVNAGLAATDTSITGVGTTREKTGATNSTGIAGSTENMGSAGTIRKEGARTSVKISAANAGGRETGNNKRSSNKKPGQNTSAGARTTITVQPPAGREDAPEPAAEKETAITYNDTGKINTRLQPGKPDSSAVKKQGADSTIIVKKDSLPVKKTTPATPVEAEEKDPEKYWQLAAGLTVYHPLAIDGESPVPYNNYGRKGSLSDYIPAVYVRLYRSRKWFLHAGFRYGAPQAVKPFDYKQEIRDSMQSVFRTVFQLRKTYYHQVPLSFNYYVLPGLSVGAGVIYNHFTGAIARQEVYRVSAQDTLLSSNIITDEEAGKFIKNHFQWSTEIQYQWKRLSLGARYSSDINPYIQYTDINTGAAVEKKAKALNIFLRYDLWRSKKWGE